jgi:hypothetical protein
LFKICFIEEDHLVSEDFYDTLKILSSIKQRGIVPGASTVALGRLAFSHCQNLIFSYFTDTGAVSSTMVAFRGFMNTGYAFNRTIWQFIKQYETIFNATDDDWDTSLAEGLINTKLIPDRQVTIIYFCLFMRRRLHPIYRGYVTLALLEVCIKLRSLRISAIKDYTLFLKEKSIGIR